MKKRKKYSKNSKEVNKNNGNLDSALGHSNNLFNRKVHKEDAKDTKEHKGGNQYKLLFQ